MKSLKNYILIVFLGLAFFGFSQENTTDENQPKTEQPTTPTVEKEAETIEATAPTEPDETNVSEGADNIFGEIPDKITDLVSSLEWYDFLFILLFNVLGYLSPIIPVLRKIGDTEIRIGVGAIVVIMIFSMGDFQTGIKLVVEFLLSTKLYEIVFKLIKKTPTPTNPTVAVKS